MPISSMIVSPFVAAAIGKVGKKPLILVIDIFLGVGVYIFMRSLEVQPSYLVVLSIVLIGVHYSIFVAIVWPSMTLTVPQTTTAAALGLATTLQNFCITILSYYFGYLNLARTKQAYDRSFFSLIVIGSVSLVLSVIVLIMDQRSGKLLSLPDADKQVGVLRRRLQERYNNQTTEREAKALASRKKGTRKNRSRPTIAKTEAATQNLV